MQILIREEKKIFIDVLLFKFKLLTVIKFPARGQGINIALLEVLEYGNHLHQTHDYLSH